MDYQELMAMPFGTAMEHLTAVVDQCFADRRSIQFKSECTHVEECIDTDWVSIADELQDAFSEGDIGGFIQLVDTRILDIIYDLENLDEYDELIYNWDINQLFKQWPAEAEELFFNNCNPSDYDSIQGMIDVAANLLYEQWQREYASDVAECLRETFDV